MAKSAELYLLTFPGGKRYIGVTKHTAQERFLIHRREARRRAPKCYVHCAIKSHGYKNVEIKTLCRGSLEFMFYLEPKAIRAFKTRWPEGLNLTDGGDGVPMVVPSESRKRQGLKMKGRKLSDLHRQRMSEAAKLRPPISEETRLKMRLRKLGKPSHKKGIPATQEFREKCRVAALRRFSHA